LAGPLFAEIIDGARGLQALEHPFEAEAWASGLLGIWQSMPSVPGIIEPDQVFGCGLVRHAQQEASDAALALLLAVAAVARAPVGAAAQAAARQLRASSATPPVWGDAVGRSTFLGGWLGVAPGCPQEAVVAVFDYAGASCHAVVLLIDYLLGGVIKDAFIAPDPDELLGRGQRLGDVSLEPVSGAVLAGRISAALGAGQRHSAALGAMVDQNARDLAALLAARLRGLPRPQPGPKTPELLLTAGGRPLFVLDARS
jgi:hypothetical protein